MVTDDGKEADDDVKDVPVWDSCCGGLDRPSRRMPMVVNAAVVAMRNNPVPHATPTAADNQMAAAVVKPCTTL